MGGGSRNKKNFHQGGEDIRECVNYKHVITAGCVVGVRSRGRGPNGWNYMTSPESEQKLVYDDFSSRFFLFFLLRGI